MSWLDIALINIFMNRKTDVISAAYRAKRFADGSNLEQSHRKEILSNFSAMIFRYVRIAGRDEAGRLLPSILEFQKEFPDEELCNMYFNDSELDPIREDVGFIKIIYKDEHEEFIKSMTCLVCANCFSDRFGLTVM